MNSTTLKNDASFCYPYPRPALSVDCVVIALMEQRLHVLLIERRNEPFKGSWALPGGFVDQDEDLDVAAARELKEETQLTSLSLQQLAAFGQPGRDPRAHVVSVAYLAAVDAKTINPVAGDDASATKWFPIEELSNLAFDHKQIIAKAMARLKELERLRQYPACLSS